MLLQAAILLAIKLEPYRFKCVLTNFHNLFFKDYLRFIAKGSLYSFSITLCLKLLRLQSFLYNARKLKFSSLYPLILSEGNKELNKERFKWINFSNV